MAKLKTNKFATSETPQKVISTAAPTQSNSTLVPLLIALLVTFVAFTSTLGNKFVNWDDDVNLIENKNTEVLDWAHVKSIFTSDVIGNYNPLPILSFTIERHFVGLSPSLYHWTNLLLHLICVFFVFKIGKKLGLSHWGAAICALLFGIHPMRVESVAWVTERKDVLFGAFYLPALYYYIKYVQEPTARKKYYVFIVLLFALALLSKVQAVALPLSMLAVDYFLRRVDMKDFFRLNLQNPIVEKTPFFLMSLAIGIVNVMMLAKNKSISLGDNITNYTFFDRLLIGAYSFIVYLMKFIFPYEMSPLYPYPAKLDMWFYVAPFAVAAVFYFFYQLYKRDNRTAIFGFGFFFLNVVFMLQIVGAGQGFLADRFTYIPYLGLFFIVAYLYDKMVATDANYRTGVSIALAFYLLMCGFMTFKQNKVWGNGGTLWTHTLKYYPDSDLPWGNRARYLRENERNYKEALISYDKAIAIKEKAELYNSRGKTYFDMSNGASFTEKALKDYDKAVALINSSIDAEGQGEIYTNRGAAYGRYSAEKNDKSYLQKALPDVIKGGEIDPTNKNAFLNAYLVYSELGNSKEAIVCIDKYNTLSPGEGDMYYSRALEMRKMGQENDALIDVNQAIALGLVQIKNASNQNDRAEKNRNQGIYYYERARIQMQLGNKAAAQTDAMSAKQYGITLEPAFEALLK